MSSKTPLAFPHLLAGERPTVRPPFDPERFAKEAESNVEQHDSEVPTAPGAKVAAALAAHTAQTVPPAPAVPQVEPSGVIPTTPKNNSDLRPAAPAELEDISLDRVPYLALAPEDLEWFDLDPQSRDLIARIDGNTNVQTLIAWGDAPLADSLRAIAELARRGIVAFC